jgi:hypothetical protein
MCGLLSSFFDPFFHPKIFLVGIHATVFVLNGLFKLLVWIMETLKNEVYLRLHI